MSMNHFVSPSGDRVAYALGVATGAVKWRTATAGDGEVQLLPRSDALFEGSRG